MEVRNVMLNQGDFPKTNGKSVDSPEGFVGVLEFLLSTAPVQQMPGQDETACQELPLSLDAANQTHVFQDINNISGNLPDLLSNNNETTEPSYSSDESNGVNLAQMQQISIPLLTTDIRQATNLTNNDVIPVDVSNGFSEMGEAEEGNAMLLQQAPNTNIQEQALQAIKADAVHSIQTTLMVSGNTKNESVLQVADSPNNVLSSSQEQEAGAQVTPVLEKEFSNEEQSKHGFIDRQTVVDENPHRHKSLTNKDEQFTAEFVMTKQENSLSAKEVGSSTRLNQMLETSLSQLPNKLTEMIRAMMIQQDPGSTTIRMKLKPEHLGEVTVKLTWSKGELSAQFVTATGLAKESLESSFPQLKQLLAQQNIRLSEAAVFMDQQAQQWDQGARRNNNWQYKYNGKTQNGYLFAVQASELTGVEVGQTATRGVNITI